ncbi:MAG: CoB--CoM heterodisulfide reductase iron-sulfur subunit A family protein, partial [Desulfobacterales bacterium]|nr:CoB--CoM heterodisulfide reductase iron-sulfur subunit A family protein [Desulfobacterales bacterium]
DLDKCTACGVCYEKFPGCVRFTPGLDHRAPTCMRYPRTTPRAFSIDMEKCADPAGLEACCPAGAIVLDDADQTRREACGAIVLAPGAALFDPSGMDNFGYVDQPDVVTSLEYERILSASGPTRGRLERPSDGRRPRKIAWIQCVGSRGLQKGAASYCSNVCCMFALKEAIITRERFGENVDATIFFMDIRTVGKGYERYQERAKNDLGVRFVRCRPHSVIRKNDEDTLSVSYAPYDGGELATEAYDMVVLSTGFKIAGDVREMAGIMGVELNEHHFARTENLNPAATNRPGIYVCGMFEGPKDIPETMTQASAAACMATAHLGSPGAVVRREEELPPERDVTGEAPRVGVFICDCGNNIGGVIDVDALTEWARSLPGVAAAEAVGHGCSGESLERIRRVVSEEGLNRVVIGGCSPRTHEIKFQDAIRKAGLNKYLLEMANIRDQAAWVHRDQPAMVAQKAEDLIRMAVSGVSSARPLVERALPMNKDVLVVGGGVSGMSAALCLAELGIHVYLAERSPELGGVAKNIRRTLEGADVGAFVRELIEKTEAHENIQVITGAIIVDHGGMPGMFRTGMQVGKQMFYRQIRHGAAVIASGALPHRPSEHLLGRHEAVMTQLDADAFIDDAPDTVKTWDNVVMIQCVGSRCPENPTCSRVCCQSAVKNALRIKKINPDARVFVLHRDVRTYGFQEDYYLRARELGVIFIRYEADDPPRVEAAEGQVDVTFRDPLLDREITVTADSLCLSAGFEVDDEDAEDLAMIFKLQRGEDGYFLEDHTKLRPVDLPIPGFFVAGSAHGPKLIRESVTQAQAVAARVQARLSKDEIQLDAAAARVDKEKCAACLVCVRACPFDVPFINADGYSEIDPARCHGCGVCAAECPAKAIQLTRFEDDRILAGLEGLFERMVA